jgi:hypothetical protein
LGTTLKYFVGFRGELNFYCADKNKVFIKHMDLSIPIKINGKNPITHDLPFLYCQNPETCSSSDVCKKNYDDA